jgi:hypothetical protein
MLTPTQMEVYKVIHAHCDLYQAPLTAKFLTEVMGYSGQSSTQVMCMKIDGKGWINYDSKNITVTGAGRNMYNAMQEATVKEASHV